MPSAKCGLGAQNLLNSLCHSINNNVAFFAVEAEGWSKAQDVALWHGTSNHAVFEQGCCYFRSDFALRVVKLACFSVLNKLYRTQKAFTTNFTNICMVTNRL